MIGILELKTKKERQEIITMITAYDYYAAKLVEKAGIDIILVGDSLGMVIKGNKNTLGVSIEDIVYHTKAVRKGAGDTFIIADLPYMSFHVNIEETKKNSAKLIVEGGADAVKLEGGSPSRIDMIKGIVDCEIPAVGHLGLTPQSIHKFGGYKVQAKQEKEAERLIKQAIEIEKAGAFMLVLEAIPEKLAKQVTDELKIITIGIGAGRYTDGQVLVYNDLFGLSDYQPKFAKQYIDLADIITKNLMKYAQDVRDKKFPEKEHIYYPLTDTE
ncbi:MAG: 3-methyl-2-oxobutanoate hydroxymethyltransferase [Candidatus Cloacimonetes bacterium]|nr:3-methyl-2-oxobutanoate hydroxymethyltransferase [Candidatus Cloacimonadota bacterium]